VFGYTEDQIAHGTLSLVSGWTSLSVVFNWYSGASASPARQQYTFGGTWQVHGYEEFNPTDEYLYACTATRIA
jgi:hypothetical protein